MYFHETPIDSINFCGYLLYSNLSKSKKTRVFFYIIIFNLNSESRFKTLLANNGNFIMHLLSECLIIMIQEKFSLGTLNQILGRQNLLDCFIYQ